MRKKSLQKNQPPTGIAVDFGGSKISAARIVKGKVIDKLLMETDGNAPIDHQLDTICGLVRKLKPTDDERLGIAVAGRVTRDGVWFAVNHKTLTKVTDVPLREHLEQRLGRAVIVQNDAIAGAMGEYVCGAGMGAQSIGYITVSTGIGGGFILSGRPVISDMGLAGHAGFTTSRIAVYLCGSGRGQTVESVAGGRAMSIAADDLGHENMQAKDVFAAHLAGERWASTIIQRAASAIAELCANLTALLDFERIIIGGSIGLAPDFIPLVRENLALEPEIFQPKIMPAELGQDSCLIGVLIDYPQSVGGS